MDITEQEKDYLFVAIFDEILHAKIQFPQTRAQPIIPHQSFIQPNKFKYSSIDLLKSNGIHWTGKNIEGIGITKDDLLNDRNNSPSNTSTNGGGDDDTTSTNSGISISSPSSSSSSSHSSSRQSYYVKDKDRSLKVNNSFMDSLEILKHRLHQKLLRSKNKCDFSLVIYLYLFIRLLEDSFKSICKQRLYFLYFPYTQ